VTFRNCFRQLLAATALATWLTSMAIAQPALMPLPAKLETASPAQFLRIEPTFSAAISGPGAADPRVGPAVLRALHRLSRQTGVFVPEKLADTSRPVTLLVTVEANDHAAPQQLGDNERYSLVVTNSQVKLVAEAPLGVLRGLETFLQLVQVGADGIGLPAVTIQDGPRFPWRGLSLDVSRHFIPLEDVKRTIDGIAAVKLNVFHWHLSDDQGFRIESKKFPKLQELGSDGLYYTQAQVTELIAYAYMRGIRVVPEFDMPGHATSWFVGYPELASAPGPYSIIRQFGVFTAAMDPTKESTYQFLDGLIGEMAALFPDAYFHVGGDEVDPKQWMANAEIQAFMKTHGIATEEALQAYFNQRLQKIVAGHGKHMEGWDEVLQPGIPTDVVIQSWRGQKSLAEAAQKGYEGLLSNGYYLDLMFPASAHYLVDPFVIPEAKPGELLNAGTEAASAVNSEVRNKGGGTTALTLEQQKRILGGEGAMWQELATPENLDVKLWPRLAVVAERLWSPESVTDLPSMYQRLEVISRWLELQGLGHRSIPRRMRERLASSSTAEGSAAALDTFAEVLEPVKEYTRADTVGGYTQSTPLNRLVDSIPPESDQARRFRELVDRYLANRQANRADLAAIDAQLVRWSTNIPQVMPVLTSNALLKETVPVANNLDQIIKTGLEALGYLKSGQIATADWVHSQTALLEAAAKQKAEVLIQIEPGVRKLVEAAGQATK
jgi:hexosaminidase